MSDQSWYTVIGYFPDWDFSRFADHFIATSADEAEGAAIVERPNLAVVGVVEGRVTMADTSAAVAFGPETG